MLSSIILNYVCIIFLNISSILLTPLFTKNMGMSTFGIYTLVYSITTFFVTTEFGMGVPVTRNIVKYKSKNDKRSEEGYLFTTICTYFLFIIFMLLTCIPIYLFTPQIFSKLSVNEISSFREIFFLSVTCSAVIFLQNFYVSIILAYDRFSFTRICNIIRIVIRTVLLYILVFYGITPFLVFFLDLILNLALLLSYIILSTKLGIKIRRTENFIKSFCSNIKVMVIAYTLPIFESFNWMAGTMIVGIVVLAEDVGKFSIATTFCLIFTFLSATLSQARIGHATKLWLEDDSKTKFWDYVFWFGKIQTLVVGFILVGFVILGRIFIILWVGEQFSVSYYIALCIIVALFIPCSQYTVEFALIAQNKYLGKSLIDFVRVVTTALLLPVGIKLSGIIGAGITIAVTLVLFKLVLMNIYYQKQGFPISKFNKTVIIKIIPSLSISIIMGLLITSLNLYSIQYAILGGTLSLISYFIVAYFTYFSKIERQYILKRNQKNKIH